MDFYRDTDPKVLEFWLGKLRGLSTEQKAAQVSSICNMTRKLAWAGLQSRHPDAPPEELEHRWAELLLGADLASRVCGPS